MTSFLLSEILLNLIANFKGRFRTTNLILTVIQNIQAINVPDGKQLQVFLMGKHRS